MNKYINKLSIMTSLLFTSFSLVGCQESSSDSLKEVPEVSVEEEHGIYDLGYVSQLANRRGEEFVGFLQKVYNPLGYPVSASVRYGDISSFSVLVSDVNFYIVKNYQEGVPLNTYYDFLRDKSVPSDLSITNVVSLKDYRKSEEAMFLNATSDSYSSFTIYDCSSLLQEETYHFDDLTSYTKEKYLGISRVSSGEKNTCYITYVPLEDVDVVGNRYVCNLVENYVSDLSTSIFQVDLLDGKKAFYGEDMTVTDFSDFVETHSDSFPLELVDFVTSDSITSYCIFNYEFRDFYDASMAVQKTR